MRSRGRPFADRNSFHDTSDHTGARTLRRWYTVGQKRKPSLVHQQTLLNCVPAELRGLSYLSYRPPHTRRTALGIIFWTCEKICEFNVMFDATLNTKLDMLIESF